MNEELTFEKFKLLLSVDSESTHLEFKKAENSFNFDGSKKSVCGYAVALANEGGGRLILGVTDKKPRKICGTAAFPNTSKLEKDLFNKIKRRVIVSEYKFEGQRVLIIDIPSRPIGEALDFEGQFLMRVRDELVPMTSDQLKKINNEAISDYSSKIMLEAKYDDLSQDAIDVLRKLLLKSGRVEKNVSKFNDKQILQDLGLIDKEKITVAALVLLGKQSSLKKFIPNAEIRYGYKVSEKEIRNQENMIFDQGYLLFYDKLWEKINSRNLSILIPQGLTASEKKVFDEETIREGLNNAIIHRDYSESETIRIIQSPYTLEITSPGGFPSGVTIENIATTTRTRNKLIADVLYKCEFVEQFGNGVNLMIRNQLSLGKNPPDYRKSDKYRVNLNIDGEIKDLEFAKYVLRIASKFELYLNDEELELLFRIKEGKNIVNNALLENLENIGVVEKINNKKYILSKQYYASINRKGLYTRRKGLDKETNKKLIIKHLEHYKRGYMNEFMEALKNIPKSTINAYLKELKKEGIVELKGKPSIGVGPNRAYWQLIKGKK